MRPHRDRKQLLEMFFFHVVPGASSALFLDHFILFAHLDPTAYKL